MLARYHPPPALTGLTRGAEPFSPERFGDAGTGGLFDPEPAYTPEQVEQLLGLHESWSDTGPKHVTALDIMSWARDPGGGIRIGLLARLEADATSSAWMGQRGPLPPDSLAACILYDFDLALKRLDLFEQAIAALTVMGFSPQEIAALIDPDAVVPLDSQHLRRGGKAFRELDRRRQRITRTLYGRPKRDGAGKKVEDANGDVVHVGGLISKLVSYMNNPPRRRDDDR